MRPTLWTIWGLLNPAEWEAIGRGAWADEVRHKRYDLRFYADGNGIRYRNDAGEIVYEPGIVAWTVLHFRTWNFRVRVRRANGSPQPCIVERKGATP